MSTGGVFPYYSLHDDVTIGTKYSRMNQVKFVEDSL